MNNLKFKLKYGRKNWKLLVHLMFSTYYFGVNNEWSSTFPSMFGVPIYKRTLSKVLLNYKLAKLRAVSCGFISKRSAQKLFN